MKKIVNVLIIIILALSVKFKIVNAKENSTIQNQIIIKEVEMDLTGDGKVENVILTGSQKEGSPLYENIKITVSDNKTGLTLFSITPTTNIGYEPTIMLGDFTGNGLPELFYGASNSSFDCGYYYLYAFTDKVLTLYDYERDFCSCKVVFKDWYNVEVFNSESSYNIDISRKEYINSIYNEGKLIKDINGEVSNVTRVSPFFDSDTERYFLSVARKITGVNSLDVIGYMVENYRYNENQTFIKQSYLLVV